MELKCFACSWRKRLMYFGSTANFFQKRLIMSSTSFLSSSLIDAKCTKMQFGRKVPHWKAVSALLIVKNKYVRTQCLQCISTCVLFLSQANAMFNISDCHNTRWFNLFPFWERSWPSSLLYST